MRQSQLETPAVVPEAPGRCGVVNLSQTPHKFTYWHASSDKAKAEAARLARKCPGERFSVIKELGHQLSEVTPPKWHEARTASGMEVESNRKTAPTSSDTEPDDFDADF